MRYLATLLLGMSLACGGSAPAPPADTDTSSVLPLTDRMAVFVELIAIDAAARTAGEAMTGVTVTQRAEAVQAQIDEAREVLATERDITIEALGEIAREGFEAEWPRF
jgi:hypothetical protein